MAMSRPIKFRAWELDTGFIRYGSYVAEDGYVMLNGSPDYDSPVVRHKICEDGYYCDVASDTVGQYTGLKDKNGVEIYEGDICKRGEWKPAAVEWDDDNCLFEFKDSYNLTLIKNKCAELEVIGNIYENKELLEQ